MPSEVKKKDFVGLSSCLKGMSRNKAAVALNYPIEECRELPFVLASWREKLKLYWTFYDIRHLQCSSPICIDIAHSRRKTAVHGNLSIACSLQIDISRSNLTLSPRTERGKSFLLV